MFSPLGIVLGVIARKQIRYSGEEGGGLALAGIVLGMIFTVMFVIYVVVAITLVHGVGDLLDNLPDQQ
ncbi:MAG: DUF4190 domain-containing protein [Geodermatophilaceae bacterium]